jgi:hypothetical protein
MASKYLVKWQEVVDYEIVVEARNGNDARDLAFTRAIDEDIVCSETHAFSVEKIREDA